MLRQAVTKRTGAKPDEAILACRGSDDKDMFIIEWCIPWKARPVKETAWEETDFIKQWSPSFGHEGWELAATIKGQFFSALRTRQKLQGMVNPCSSRTTHK